MTAHYIVPKPATTPFYFQYWKQIGIKNEEFHVRLEFEHHYVPHRLPELPLLLGIRCFFKLFQSSFNEYNCIRHNQTKINWYIYVKFTYVVRDFYNCMLAVSILV